MDRDGPMIEHRSDRGLHIAVVSVVALALIAGLAIGFVLYQAIQPGKYDPLGDFPVQRVDSTVPGIDGPAAILGDDVLVTGTKCNATGHAVQTRGTYVWRLVDPPGTTVQAHPPSVSTLAPGCTTRTFSNVVPEKVITRSKHVYLETGKNPVWQITGYAHPYTADGERGKVRLYESQNFTLVVR